MSFAGDGLYVGLSGERPTAGIGSGTRFLDRSTGVGSFYDGSSWQQTPRVDVGPSYVLWVSGVTCQVMNTATGLVEFSGVNQTSGFGHAFNNLTSGRTWKEVVAPKGSFTVTSLKLPSYTLFDCSQAIITQSGTTNNNMISNENQTSGNVNIEIVGGIFDGNKSGQGAGGTENSQSMMFFIYCSGVWLHHGLYRYGDFHQFRFWECPWDIRVTDCTSIDPRHEHISDHAHSGTIGAFRGHVFADNVFKNISGGNSFIAITNVSDTLVTGNVCERTFDTSAIAIDAKRATVSNNTIKEADIAGIILAQLSGDNHAAHGSIVTNNTVLGTINGSSIITSAPTTDLIVSNNYIDNSGQVAAGQAGIAIAQGKNLVITNNIVRNSYGNGIIVYGGGISGNSDFTCRDAVVSNNVCYNNGRQSGATDNNNAGIQVRSIGVTGDVSRVAVYNNRCYDTSTSGGQKYGLRVATTTNCVVKDNDLRNNVISGFIQASNTGLIMYGNVGVDE